MRILAFLQNQWFHNPQRAREYLTHCNARGRARYVSGALFSGCLTGRRIRAAFDDLCEAIIFENASPVISDSPKASPPADIEHMARAVQEWQPGIVVLFGHAARGGYEEMITRVYKCEVCQHVIYAPHPAARHAGVVQELYDAAFRVRSIIATDPTHEIGQILDRCAPFHRAANVHIGSTV